MGNENHLLQADKSHAWAELNGHGFLALRGEEPLPYFHEYHMQSYASFGRAAVFSIRTHGYYVMLATPIQPNGQQYRTVVPEVLSPNLYCLVSQRILEYAFPQLAQTRRFAPFHVIFFNVRDEEMYGLDDLWPFVVYPPTDEGCLTCPMAQVYTMSDITNTHLQLHLVAANINAAPQFLAARSTDGRPNMMVTADWFAMEQQFVSEKDAIGQLETPNITPAKDKPQFASWEEMVAAGVAREERSLEGHAQSSLEINRLYTNDTVVPPPMQTFVTQSRLMSVTARKDPVLVRYKQDNMHFTPVPMVRTVEQFAEVIQLLDRRTAIALGLPLGLLSMEEHSSGMGPWTDIAFRQWRKILADIRTVINEGLQVFANAYFNIPGAKIYAKTKDPVFALPVTLQLATAMTPDDLDRIKEHLTPAALSRHVAGVYSIPAEDIDVARLQRQYDGELTALETANKRPKPAK
jgi:hypothetical protein